MKKNDLILIAIILLLSVGGFALFRLFLPSTTGDAGKVIVTIDGEVYGEYPLNKDATITIPAAYGNNILEIKDGNAVMTKAECPDQICVHHPAIHLSGEMIICLPNEIIVEVVGGSESTMDTTAQ